MANSKKSPDPVADLLKDLLITQLACAGVPGADIRTILGCDMNRVTRIIKHIGKEPKRKKGRA